MIKPRSVGLAFVPVTAVALLLVLVLLHAPNAVRFPLTALVFFLAPGIAGLGIPRSDAALRWSVVIGLSLGINLLLAELLVVSKHLYVIPFLAFLLAIVALISLGKATLARQFVAAPITGSN